MQETLEANRHSDDTEDAKESKILSAAREAFLELGFAATSMDLVAQRAKASKTTVYTRFPSKEALFAAVVRRECERSGMRFSPADLADLPVRDALCRIGRRFVDLIWSPQATRVHQIVIGEATRFPELARVFHEEGPVKGTAAVAAYMADAASRGLIAIDDPTFAAGQFLSSLKGMPYCEMLAGLRPETSALERDVYVGDAVDLFLNGARPRA